MIASLLRSYVRFRQTRSDREIQRPSPVHSIVVVELTRLGDVICTFRSLARLRAAYPAASLTCVVQEPYAELVEALDLNIRAIGLRLSQTARGIVAGLGILRSHRFDLACSMSPAKRNALLVIGSRARVKAGYLTYLDARAQYLHRTPVNILGRRASSARSYALQHISFRSSFVCDVLGIPDLAPGRKPAFRPEVLAAARTNIKAFPVGRHAPYIVMHPFAAWEYKEWPAASFAGLADAVVAECGHDVVVTCESADLRHWEQAARMLQHPDRVHVLSHCSLLELAALMRGASLAVGNDSGPLHLASQVGTPVVGLYGPASPGLTAPDMEKGVFLYHAMECSPCPQRICVHPDSYCMNLIGVNEVLEAIRSLLGTRMQTGAAPNA